ncbi:putative protein phosphatase 2C 55 [Prunus yedoensis var. nudiflora]|uniref:Protein phosphatase n=1 Tax=Prunus yedoensis var. nudiflora TaxID=2094558 RepID=A0A314UPF0_PRUYE|nr:putative protein phosphatase 2C 55 [Prunus yedoensis var. nudiflora]
MMIAANMLPALGLGPQIDNCYGSCGYGYGLAPDQKRKLENPIDEVQELQDTYKRRKIQNEKMKLVCGSSYCPKDNPEKPLGEDAHFISHFAQTIGVADGVGGWARKGIDAGEYARGIMNHAKETATHMAAVGATPVDARKVLNEAYAYNADVQGSSTACILSFDKERGSLHAVNVGDSGFMLFREAMCVYISPTQQRRFNCPYQLGNHVHSDRPDAAEEFEVEDIMPGTLSYSGQMGCWTTCLRELATTIATLALFNSEDEDNVTPFQMAAEKAGVEHVGGKIDDITVVVAIVVASST